jgi:hypothetical protein
MSKSGYISPSQFSRIMTDSDLKKGIDYFGAGAETYAIELAMQRIGITTEEVKARPMEWGIEHEWEALRAYEAQTMATVEPVKEPVHWDRSEWVRGYPDGLVGLDGLVEVKCPYVPTHHYRNLKNAHQYHADYKPQVQGYLMLTGRKWADFISFDPRFPEQHQLAVHRFERDEPYLEILAARVLAFDAFVNRYAL